MHIQDFIGDTDNIQHAPPPLPVKLAFMTKEMFELEIETKLQ